MFIQSSICFLESLRLLATRILYGRNALFKTQVLHVFLLILSIIPFQLIAQSFFTSDHSTRFENIGIDQGLSSNNITCYHQDNFGFIWFGTQNGLNLYNGLEFKIFRNEVKNSETIPSDYIYKIIEGKDSVIWICSEIGLSRYDRASESFTNFFPDSANLYNPINKIRELYEEGDFILLNAGNKLFKFNTNTGGFQNLEKILVAPFNDFTEPGTMYPSSTGKILILENLNDDLYINYFDIKNNQFQSYSSSDSNSLKPLELRITMAYESISGDIWLATFGNGIYKLSLNQQNTYEVTHYNRKQSNSLISNYYLDIFEDSHSNILIGGKWGFHKLLDDGKEISRVNDSINTIIMMGYGTRHFSEDQNDCLWLTSGGGIFKYNPLNRKFTFYRPDPKLETSLSGNPFASFTDKVGQTWIITGNSGISRFNPFANSFSHIQNSKNGLSHNQVNSFLVDRYGDFWVGTYGGGLNRTSYDQNHRYENFDHYFKPEDEINTGSYYANFYISHLYEDKSGQVWVGTYNGLHKYVRERNSFIHYQPFKNDPSNIGGDVITAIYEDHKGVFWVGTQNGLHIFNRDKETFHTFYHDPEDSTSLGSNDIRVIYEDSNNDLWFGGKYLKKFVRQDTSFITYKPEPNKPNSISDDYIQTIIEGDNGHLWLGTNKGLIKMNSEAETFISINANNEQTEDIIKGMCMDGSGNLWISKGRTGLSKYNPKTGEFKYFNKTDGLVSDEFEAGSYFKDKDGWIYFGSRDGFNLFNPKNIKENSVIPRVYITSFKLFGERKYFDKALYQKEKISLDFDENEFTFDFVALNYLNSKKNQYAYVLEGYDDDWIYTNDQRFAKYTNMSPGTYTFRVKASNNDGYWNEKGASLDLIIHPPYWKSIWAYLFYAIVFFMILYLLRRYELNRLSLKQKLEINNLKAEKLAELDREKNRFFSNISHEFRTPLTLILGPLNRIIEKLDNKKQKEELNLVRRNANRLHTLINQLLSLAKLESGKMKLKASPEDIVKLTSVLVQSFHSLAENKKIALEFESDKDDYMVYIDKIKYEKICINLLSNAIKFTKRGGRVRVSISKLILHEEAQEQIRIRFSDNGIGIPKDKLDHVFDRFFQVDEGQEHTQIGTGIGLALTKELVELHHGRILVESDLTKGSTFNVFIYLGKDHLSEDEIVKSNGDKTILEEEFVNEDYFVDPDSKIKTEIDAQNNGNKQLPLLLIVDDNEDMREYIKSYLSELYNTIEASNGKEGAELAFEHMPDLIISDLMMPILDGNEMTEQLKQDERTSHIPIILLTAKASRESKLEGLETGADDFLTKPFDADELMVRIKNLIDQRKNLSILLSKHLGDPAQTRLIRESSGKLMSKVDEGFIEKSYKVIEKRMSDPDLNVELFAKEMGMSRMQLHRKLSSLTGNSTSDLIRNIRLKKAADLLAEGELNVTEVSYEIGISSLSNFAKIFKEKYGISPSEYITKK